jgi:hypothetical protein
MGAERDRLDTEPDASGLTDWHDWGPHVAERAWGTVREDYSADGDAWAWFPHDHARSRAYRWGEDGLAGVSDRRQGLCVALALWNGVDPYLKERPFGLANAEGNHGEDAKDMWWHLDGLPSSAWLSMRYHYPQAPFPYDDLVRTNEARGLDEPEYELLDTGVFDDGRYWVVDVDYAKDAPDDICMRVRVRNAGPDPATLHVLPHLWFRNTWRWTADDDVAVPRLTWEEQLDAVRVEHPGRLGTWLVTARAAGPSDDAVAPGGDPTGPAAHSGAPGEPTWVFCENETNQPRIWGEGTPTLTPYPKDGINDHVVDGAATVNPALSGTKAAAWWTVTAGPGEVHELRLRLACVAAPATARDRGRDDRTNADADALAGDDPSGLVDPGGGADDGSGTDQDAVSTAMSPLAPREGCQFPTRTRRAVPDVGAGFEAVMAARRADADEFYGELTPEGTTAEEARIMRQAFAGLLWSRQFYRYDVGRWLDGDPGQPDPPADRGAVRNGPWRNLDANDVISMPDTWEYPWFASWDLAFHCVAMAHIDPAFAKHQLLLLTREWYQHPNGQLPAYEWDFGDANPPVHAWAAMRVYETDGKRDRLWLERVFHKLVINFTWWVNRQDAEGDNVFEGGFLGLDNIGPFNRSAPLPDGATLEQSDGTAWMAMYCLNLLEIAITLAAEDDAYQDMAVKFLEHFTLIAAALSEAGLWDDEDGFFYDVVRRPDGMVERVKVRSMVGLIPLAALTVIDQTQISRLTEFRQRAAWYVSHRRNLAGAVGRFIRARRVDLVTDGVTPGEAAVVEPATTSATGEEHGLAVDADDEARLSDAVVSAPVVGPTGTESEVVTAPVAVAEHRRAGTDANSTAGDGAGGAVGDADGTPDGERSTGGRTDATPPAPLPAVGAMVPGSVGMPGEQTTPAVMLAVASPDRLLRLLRPALDEAEFLSPHGLRSLSRWHLDHPVSVTLGDETYTVAYTPAESTSRLFGGNSNWRGPVWFPLNFLLLESLLRAHRFVGDGPTLEMPVGSGRQLTLAQVADDLAERLIGLFRAVPDDDGVARRPAASAGGLGRFEDDPDWNEMPAFYEYFHGDSGAGLGAAHQTGWTALVADLLISRPLRRRLAGDR